MKKAKTMKASSLIIRNKKGVSPLIATVLLIAFAVALGAVVMNWGRSYVDETTAFATKKSSTEVKCSMDIGLEFVEIGERKQVCLDNETDTLNFTIRNRGTVVISGIKVQALSSSLNVIESDMNETLGIAGIKRSYINYSIENNGTLEKILFTPMILIEGSKTLCARNTLQEEDIGICGT